MTSPLDSRHRARLHLDAVLRTSVPWLVVVPLVFATSAHGQESAPGQEGLTEDRLNACFDSYEQSQLLQREGKLNEARTLATACTERCPAEIIAECEALESDVSRDLATALILAVTERGTDAEDVQVEVNGEAQQIGPGGELALNPGPHTIRFSRRGDGWEERVEVVMRRGEKRRQIRVVVPPLGESGMKQDKQSSRSGSESSGPSAVKPWIITSYAFGAVGFALAGAGGIIALNDRSTLDDCRPTCEPDLARRLDRRSDTWLTNADVGLGVGAVGVITGTALWIWGPKKQASTQATVFRVLPTPGGAAALMSTSF